MEKQVKQENTKLIANKEMQKITTIQLYIRRKLKSECLVSFTTTISYKKKTKRIKKTILVFLGLRWRRFFNR
ncbi:unnamed protein product [Arabidopsis halleri]